MKGNALKRLLATTAMGLLGVTTTASATVVSGTPDTDFSNGMLSLSTFGGAATFDFKDTGSGFPVDAVAVKTSGTGGINTDFGRPATYGIGPEIGTTIAGGFSTNYQPYSSYTKLRYSNGKFLALAADLNDGRHYGYVKIRGPELLSYGFETTPGTSIQGGVTGEPANFTTTVSSINAVPGPGSLSLFSMAFALVGLGVTASRRRRH